MARNYKKLTLIIGILFIVIIVGFVIYRVITVKDKLIVGHMQISSHAPLFAAKEMKKFEEHGLSIELEQYPDTPTLMNALISGKIDIGYQLTSDVVFKSAAEGNEYYIYYVAISTETDPIDGFYALSEIDSESLKEKRIGHFPGPTGAAMTKRIIESRYNLKQDEYELIPVAPSLQVSSLQSGRIAALFTYEPIGTVLVKRLNALKVLKGPVEEYVLKGPWYGGIGVLSADLVQRRRAVARSFREAIYETMEILEKDKELYARAMSEMQPGLSIDLAREVPTTIAVFARSKKERSTLLEALERQISIYRDLGLLPSSGRANIKIFVD